MTERSDFRNNILNESVELNSLLTQKEVEDLNGFIKFNDSFSKFCNKFDSIFIYKARNKAIEIIFDKLSKDNLFMDYITKSNELSKDISSANEINKYLNEIEDKTAEQKDIISKYLKTDFNKTNFYMDEDINGYLLEDDSNNLNIIKNNLFKVRKNIILINKLSNKLSNKMSNKMFNKKRKKLQNSKNELLNQVQDFVLNCILYMRSINNLYRFKQICKYLSFDKNKSLIIQQSFDELILHLKNIMNFIQQAMLKTKLNDKIDTEFKMPFSITKNS